ncbi:MAG: hypothetical protein H7321_07925, partial [Bacteroidia bacterium]|nr:hypothetical protein [Bacteroidia bacterium]
MVNKCVMDKKGFIWLATEGGLSRFDGLNFRNFTQKTDDTLSLPAHLLTNIVSDNNEKLWLGSNKCLFSFNIKTEKIYAPDHYLAKGEIKAIAIDTLNDCLWFINETLHKLGCYHYNNGQMDTFKSKMPQNACDIEMYKGALFMSFQRIGVYKFDLKTHKKSKVLDNWTLNFYKDKNRLWISVWQDNLYLYDDVSDSFISYNLDISINGDPQVYISMSLTKAPSISPDNILWIATQADGLVAYNTDQKKPVFGYKYSPREKQSIVTDYTNYIYYDKLGNLWLCSWRGLMLINPLDQEFKSKQLEYLDTRGYNSVNGMVRDKINPEIIWISANGSGICKYNTQKQKALKQFFYYDENAD